MMTSLRELQQRAYRAIVLDEEPALPYVGRDAASVAARLGVYRNNVRVTFERTLAATFPVVRRLVGDLCFKSLVRTFMRDFPSRHGDLAELGGEFPLLLDIYYRDTRFAYLTDVARLEWARAEVEVAAECGPLDLGRLETVAPHRYGALRFMLRPAARLLCSRYPILTIWEAHQTEDARRVVLEAGAEHVLVIRSASVVRLERLDAPTFAFAQSLADGEPLADALDAAAAISHAFDAGASLATLARLGLLAAVVPG